MVDVDEILINMSNFASEIDSGYQAIPLDNNLKLSSPINEINSNLLPFPN